MTDGTRWEAHGNRHLESCAAAGYGLWAPTSPFPSPLSPIGSSFCKTPTHNANRQAEVGAIGCRFSVADLLEGGTEGSPRVTSGLTPAATWRSRNRRASRWGAPGRCRRGGCRALCRETQRPGGACTPRLSRVAGRAPAPCPQQGPFPSPGSSWTCSRTGPLLQHNP